MLRRIENSIAIATVATSAGSSQVVKCSKMVTGELNRQCINYHSLSKIRTQEESKVIRY